MHDEPLFHITLPNQRRLRFRPLRTTESGALNDFYAPLTPLTRYRRFLSPMPVLSDAVLEHLTRQSDRHVSLVAEEDDTPGAAGAIVALGTFGATNDDSGEVGLVVRDDWQRQGVGIALATHLLRTAEARGFHRFFAHMLSDNPAIRALLERLGRVLTVRSRAGVVEVQFVLR